MSCIQVIILAIVQGLTEFLPVSSSGHLVIIQKLFGLKPPIVFDILVHVGTLGAVIFYFRQSLVKIGHTKIFWLVVIGTIPAGVAGFFLQNYLSLIFDSLKLVGVALLVTSGFLFSTKLVKKQDKKLSHLKWSDALTIGIFQALALLPGVSRSGSTIVAGLWRKVNRQAAFQFSFLLAIPAIIGALVLQIPHLLNAGFVFLNQGILGMIIAGIVGYGTLKILEVTLLRAKLWLFGFYCLLLGTAVLLI